MTIQPVSGKANSTGASLKSVTTEKVKSTEPQATNKSKDNLDITAVAKEITKAFGSSQKSQIINEERVNAVRKALDEGSYPIDAERIAKKMIQMEREQFNNSR